MPVLVIMPFQPRQLPLLRVRASCRSGYSELPGFTEKNEWPPNSPDLNPLDYHISGTMLGEYHKPQLKPKMTDELKVALQTIWE